MTTVQTIKTPVGRATPKAKDNARVASVVAAFLAGNEAVDAANSQLVSAKVSLLSSVTAALKGCDPVDGDSWAKDWAEPTLKALIASGRYTVDDKGRSLSASSAASNLKIAVIAITNDVEPDEAASSLKNFVQAVRPKLVSEDLIEATTAGAKSKGEERRKPEGAAMTAALFLVARKDKKRAAMLGKIMADAPEVFDAWARKAIAALD
ncbi:MAG: hypothetical protein ACXWCO_00630 [Caldimonas sp.]